MKKYSLTSKAAIAILILLIFNSCNKIDESDYHYKANANIVPISIAKAVAENFNPPVYFNNNNSTNHDPVKVTLDGNNLIENNITFNDEDGVPAVYIFNFAQNQGFLIVSADYQVEPILAFVEQGSFDNNKWESQTKTNEEVIPYGFVRWMNKIVKNIGIERKGMHNNLSAQFAWKNYLARNSVTGMTATDAKTKALMESITKGTNSDTIPQSGTQITPLPTNPCSIDPDYYSNTSTTVGPLLSVTWGQGLTYNDDCPNLGCIGITGLNNAVTGCVATSTAEVLYYWHPVNNYNYNYSSMPAIYGNDEVARLMHDIGVQVNMQYGCTESSAYTSDVPNVLKNSFGIATANYASYNSRLDVLNKVMGNLNNNQPVILAGTDAVAGGHQWVCDGYSQGTQTYCGLNGMPQTATGFTHELGMA